MLNEQERNEKEKGMTFITHKKITALFLFTHFIISSTPLNAAEEFINSLFGPPKPPNPSKVSHQQKGASPARLSEVAPPETKAPSLEESQFQRTERFFQDLPTILQHMDNLEKRMWLLLPHHPRNPRKTNESPDDWRYLMAVPVAEPLEGTLRDRLAKFPSTQDLINRGLLLDVEAFKKKVADEEALRKKQALEQAKESKKKKLQKSTSVPNLTENSDTADKSNQEPSEDTLTGQLRLWLYSKSSLSSQALPKTFFNGSVFIEWWRTLPPELVDSKLYKEAVKLLPAVLKVGGERPVGITVNTLNELFNQSLLLRAQALYGQFLPLFLDARVGRRTLINLKEEADREDEGLRAILSDSKIVEKTTLMKAIEGNIISVLCDAVLPPFHAALDQSKEVDRKECVLHAFYQAVQELLNDRSVAYNKIKIEKRAFTEEHLASIKAMKLELQKGIVKVVREALDNALRQATGTLVQAEQPAGRLTYWRSTPKKAPDLDPNLITIDIAPILQKIDKFLNPPQQQTGYMAKLWASKEKTFAPQLVRPPLSEEVMKQWRLLPYRQVEKTGRKWVSKRSRSTSTKAIEKRNFPTVEVKAITFEESRAQYVRSLSPEREDIQLKSRVMEEMLGLKEAQNTPTLKSFKLREFFNPPRKEKVSPGGKEKASAASAEEIVPVRVFSDMLRVFTYSPGIDAVQFYPRIFTFIEQFVEQVIENQMALQKTDDTHLGAYLNPTRPSRSFYKKERKSLARLFPLLKEAELSSELASAEVFKESGDKFKIAAENDEFRGELIGHVLWLSRFEKLTIAHHEAIPPVEQLVKEVKKALLFKMKCEAFSENKSLPLDQEQETAVNTFFESKYTHGVQEGLERQNKRDHSAKPMSNGTAVMQDWSVLLPFFKTLLLETLTSCLSSFEVPEGTLEKLKKQCEGS